MHQVVNLRKVQSLELDLQCPADPLCLDELLFMHEGKSIMLWRLLLNKVAIKGHTAAYDRYHDVQVNMP
jgi:hypothetical protein